jgi:hypothetical protein
LTFLQPAYGDGSLQVCRESIGSLAFVTQLRHLHVVYDSEVLTKASLLPLTNLTALTEFHCGTGLDVGWVVLHSSKQVRTAYLHAQGCAPSWMLECLQPAGMGVV